jgi:fatty acid desaturase
MACIVQRTPLEACPERAAERRNAMLWTLIVILLVLWLLGLIGSVGGAFINLLLVVALVVLLFQLLSGRRVA